MVNANIGDIVYGIEQWTDRIFKGKVTKVYQTKDFNEQMINVADFDYIGYAFCDEPCRGSNTYALAHLYTSADEAYDAVNQERNNAINSYKAEITDITSLVRFALNHCIAEGNEYTNAEARQAYIERAGELNIYV